MSQTGKTTGNVKLRSGPGMQFEPPLAFLTPDTALEVLGQEGDWVHVRVNGKEGYVGHKYVEVSDSGSLKSTAGAVDSIHKPAADQPPASGGITKRAGPPPNQMPTEHGKAHKGVEEE